MSPAPACPRDLARDSLVTAWAASTATLAWSAISHTTDTVQTRAQSQMSVYKRCQCSCMSSGKSQTRPHAHVNRFSMAPSVSLGHWLYAAVLSASHFTRSAA